MTLDGLFVTLEAYVEVEKNMLDKKTADKSKLPLPIPTPETIHFWEVT